MELLIWVLFVFFWVIVGASWFTVREARREKEATRNLNDALDRALSVR